MKKSKAETAETRKRIVAMAAKVFLEHGIAATGIADIMKEAGLTQGGFYRHFESKEQLIAEASEEAFNQIDAVLGLAVAGMGPRQAFDTIVRKYLRQRQGTGPLCPLASLGSELPHSDAQVRAIVNIAHQRMVANLSALLRQLDMAEPAAVADAVVSTMLGAVTIARLAQTDASAESILDNAEHTIGLLLRSSPRVDGAKAAVHR
ncbi:MAG: TetR family transcriptional regulator [Rhodoferax sp.]|nr:TetR family transcriptional regulator [Rhodoferax sp.]